MSNLTPDQEKQIFRDMEQFSNTVAAKRRELTPQLAQTVNDLYRKYPTTDASVLLSSVQAYTAGKMGEDQLNKFLEDFNKMEYDKLVAQQNAAKKDNQSWWQRNVASKFRSGMRWALAGLDFIPQSVTNVSSQIANPAANLDPLLASRQRGAMPGGMIPTISRVAATTPNPTSGFIISTSLGTMLEDSKLSGDGYFLSGEAAKLQGERARRYRGEIAGHAWTPGRATANVIFQPGTVPYEVLSGLVDMVPAIAVPSVPGAGQIKGATKGLLTLAGVRTLSGLTNYSSAMIIPEKASAFLNSRSGRKVIQKLTEIKSIDEAIDVFPTASPLFLKNIAETNTEAAMKQLLQDTLGLGDVTRGVAPTSIDDIKISSWDNMKRGILQGESKVARLMASVPGRHVVLAGGSDREKIQSIKNVKGYLRSLNRWNNKAVPEELRVKLVDDFANALINDDGSMRNVVDQIENMSRIAFDSLGLHQKLTNKLLTGIKDFKSAHEASLFGDIGAGGKSADHNGEFLAQLDDGTTAIVKQPLNTAGVQTEMLKHIMMLPDPQQIRRIVAGPLGWVTGKAGKLGDVTKKGELRTPLVIAEWITGQVWKPFALLTGAYALRNMSDSLLRQTFSPDLKSGIYHPLDLIQIAMHKRYKGDVLGSMFKGDPEELLRRNQRELVDATNRGMREVDPVSRHVREQLTGTWKRVIREDGNDTFSQGVAAEIALLAGDDIARMVADGASLDEIVSFLEGPGRKNLDRLDNMWSSKNLVDANGNNARGSIKFRNADGTVFRDNLETYINQYVLPRVDATTGGSTTLREMIAKAGFTDSNGKFVPVFDMDQNGVYGYLEDNLFPAIRAEMDNPNVNLKEFYKMQVVSKTTSSAGHPVNAIKNFIVDKFFGELYPKREAWLNRSPAFRQFYYNLIGEWSDQLAPGEILQLQNNIRKVAEEQGKKFNIDFVRSYVGDKKLAETIVSGTSTSTGKLSLTQLDAYAKGYALDETKKLFYDAAEKSNFADIMRIIVPFGSAWYEVNKKWLKMLSSDPETLKRMSVSVRGLINADPDNDGKGFFYKDPATGEYVFNYPFSDQLGPFVLGFAGAALGAIGGGLPGALIGGAGGAGLGAVGQSQLDGINPFAVAPVKSLNMALNLLPGTVPWVQIPASAILQHYPEADFLNKIIAPYGAPDMSASVAPSWGIKLYQAVLGDPEKDRMFGDLVLDTMKALGASGKYDLADPIQRDKLQKEAIHDARILMVFRALGQLAGPVRPNIEFKVNTKQGDVYSNELAKTFYELQAQNYDTAVQKFMEMFGDDAFLYIAGKTKAIAGGLDASVEFGRWERKNGGLFDTYPEVAGYFAPVGSNFDYQVYLRQIESGGRKRLSPTELIQEAQFRVGSAVYRSLRREFGDNPSKREEDLLRQFKKEVGDKYPGYRDAAIDVNQQKTRINGLYDAVNDKRLDGNPVAEALRVYFKARDEALAVAQSRGVDDLSNKKMADARGFLFRLGENLADQYPEFERVWDRVLFNEVDTNVEVTR